MAAVGFKEEDKEQIRKRKEAEAKAAKGKAVVYPPGVEPDSVKGAAANVRIEANRATEPIQDAVTSGSKGFVGGIKKAAEGMRSGATAFKEHSDRVDDLVLGENFKEGAGVAKDKLSESNINKNIKSTADDIATLTKQGQYPQAVGRGVAGIIKQPLAAAKDIKANVLDPYYGGIKKGISKAVDVATDVGAGVIEGATGYNPKEELSSKPAQVVSDSVNPTVAPEQTGSVGGGLKMPEEGGYGIKANANLPDAPAVDLVSEQTVIGGKQKPEQIIGATIPNTRLKAFNQNVADPNQTGTTTDNRTGLQISGVSRQAGADFLAGGGGQGYGVGGNRANRTRTSRRNIQLSPYLSDDRSVSQRRVDRGPVSADPVGQGATRRDPRLDSKDPNIRRDARIEAIAEANNQLKNAQARESYRRADTADVNAGANVMNAETNKSGLGIRQQVADTGPYSAETGRYSAETGRLGYGVNAANAETNRMNALTRSGRASSDAGYQEGQLSLAEQKNAREQKLFDLQEQYASPETSPEDRALILQQVNLLKGTVDKPGDLKSHKVITGYDDENNPIYETQWTQDGRVRTDIGQQQQETPAHLAHLDINQQTAYQRDLAEWRRKNYSPEKMRKLARKKGYLPK